MREVKSRRKMGGDAKLFSMLKQLSDKGNGPNRNTDNFFI